jgi:hypothetical protein
VAILNESSSQYDIGSEPEFGQIEIIAQYDGSVVIDLNQYLITNGTLCVFSILYQSVDDVMRCPNETNVGLGYVDQYTVKCVGGIAEVILYA